MATLAKGDPQVRPCAAGCARKPRRLAHRLAAKPTFASIVFSTRQIGAFMQYYQLLIDT